MGDRSYIYGDHNGASYTEEPKTSDQKPVERTHWDPRFEIQVIAGTVQIGIVPSSDESTDAQGVWNNDDGQFMTISRSGLNRLIRAARECRDVAYGKDE